MIKKGITIFVAFLAVVCGVAWYGAYLPLSSKIGGPSSKFLPFSLQLGALLGHVGSTLGMSRIKVIRALFGFFGEDWVEIGEQEWKKGINIADAMIAGVPVTIFQPETQDAASPGLFYLHGGGLAFGSRKYKAFMVPCAMLARGSKSVVISIDYRLAPEHILPAQFDDVLAVVSAVMKEPKKFGVDGNRLALAGDSAGGLLSSAISLEFAKLTGPNKIAAQVLIYPWVQSIDFVCLPSYQTYKDGFALSDKSMAYYASYATMGDSSMVLEYLSGNVSQYFMHTPYWKYLAELSNCEIPTVKSKVNLPSSFVEKVTDPRLSPLLADDVSGSPPTFVTVAEYDVLANEATLFAKRLKEAGVHVVEKHYKTYHAFIQNVGLPTGNDTIAKIALKDIVNFLNSVFYNDV
jgi:acetyl esterase/lipase